MKKIILIALFAFSAAAVSAKPIIYHKNKGGLFGYKYVSTTILPSGTIVVDCDQGGLTRCRAASSARVGVDGPELTPEAFQAIDDKVMADLNPENTNGRFIYDSSLYVSYAYDIAGDYLTVTIYTVEEATGLGLIN